jgi:putative molybdopterin biosynthesis protein
MDRHGSWGKAELDSSTNQDQFLEVVDRDEAERRFRAVFTPRVLDPQEAPLAEAHGRVLAADVVASVDVPGFDRSDVDGFAVRAADTYGSSEESPARLAVTGETLSTGIQPTREVGKGEASAIATGAMVPRGADAVVMIEDTHSDSNCVLVHRPATPGTNITFTGADIAKGETVLRRGQRLSARETGVLAAIGLDRVSVIRKPQVAILSTGCEIVAPGAAIRPGLVYDSNATVIADTIRELGGEPVPLGIFPDDADRLRVALMDALRYDLVVVSGGTSKGAGDLSYRVVGELGPPGIVVHGVALKPGKPLCLAVVKDKPIAVLPGFPTSAVFTFREFVGPVLRTMAGLPPDDPKTVLARVPFRVQSVRGRTEYLLVSLIHSPSGWTAHPIGKGSGSVTTFSHADGYITIPRNREYLETGDSVEVRMIAPEVQLADLVVVGSHCFGLDWLLSRLMERGYSTKFLAVGSTGGVQAVRRAECDIAGVHLLDPATGVYNRSFVPENAEWRPGYRRRQGFVFRQDDPRFKDVDLETAVARALGGTTCRMINRNRGSGTRILIDQLLGGAHPEGYAVEAKSHHAVAAAVAQGRADWGITIEAAAELSGLGFLPYRDEHFDFLVARERKNRPAVAAFFALLDERHTQQALANMGLEPTKADR